MEKDKALQDTKQKKPEYQVFEGVKFAVQASTAEHKLVLFDSYTERPPETELPEDAEPDKKELSGFAFRMYEYAEAYKNWERNRGTHLCVYNKKETIKSKQDVAVTAKCYFSDHAKKMLRSLKDYGVDISGYSGESQYAEMYNVTELSANILHALIKDFPEREIELFLVKLVTIADGLHKRCNDIKAEYIDSAMVALKSYNTVKEQ